MKMSQHQIPGSASGITGYNTGHHQPSHHNNHQVETGSSYSKQPRKAASQDRMARDQGASGSGMHHSNNMSHSNALGHSTFSNLNASVLAQKRSNSTSHYKGSATKKSSSSHHYNGSTKKSSSTTRHGYGHKEHGSHHGSTAIANHAYGTSS